MKTSKTIRTSLHKHETVPSLLAIDEEVKFGKKSGDHFFGIQEFGVPDTRYVLVNYSIPGCFRMLYLKQAAVMK